MCVVRKVRKITIGCLVFIVRNAKFSGVVINPTKRLLLVPHERPVIKLVKLKILRRDGDKVNSVAGCMVNCAWAVTAL